MGWGTRLAGAWNAASGTARNAAHAVADTAHGALNRVANIVHPQAAVPPVVVPIVAAPVVVPAPVVLPPVVPIPVVPAPVVPAPVVPAPVVGGPVAPVFQAANAAFNPNPAGGLLQPCALAALPPVVAPVVPVLPVPVPVAPVAVPLVVAPVVAPVEDYNIVSVEWLNGDDVTTIGACEQFVNLPRDAKWLADSGIANIDRLGIKPRFLVTFDKPCSAGYQWRIVPLGGDAPDYTASEEGRNPNFVPGEKAWTTGQVTDGKQIVADGAKLVAGGGYKFKIEAKDDKNKVVTSGIITTNRLFWYVELPMTGLATVLASTTDVDAEFAKHHIMLKQLPDLVIAHQENIGTDADILTMAANVTAAIAADAAATAKAPYLLRISYTDQLAVKNPARPQRVDGVAVGPAAAAVPIPVSSVGLLPGDGEKPRPLWQGIVAGESWFVSAEYTPTVGGAAIAIAADKVTPGTAVASVKSINVDVTGLPAGTGSITVTVDVVDRMRGGLAIGGAGDICICTRGWWKATTDVGQARTVIHEMGHKVQAVVEGAAIQPDRTATQYNGSGHAGSHCHTGCTAGQANFNTRDNMTASTCAMFGTGNDKLIFCANCAPAAKKVDIGAGF